MINKVLLVHPKISTSKYNFVGIIENEPLELEYIVSVLAKKNITSEIYDEQRENITLEEKIKEYKPTVIYICGRIKQENYIKEHAKNIKNLDKNIVTIVGGLHAQKNYKVFFMPEVDYILTTFDIFKIINIIENEDLTKITGICYKKNNKWIINEAEPFDINKLPLPNREYFYSHIKSYRYLELQPCAQIRTSYCCQFRCNFCYRNQTNCGKYVCRSILDVVNEIESIDCENIYFIDDDFLLDVTRIKEFIRLIKERNINKKYVCFGRVDFIIKNKEIIKELKEIGFYYILVGLEAITNENLNKYNKQINLNNNIECVRFMNDIGINIMGMFIVDFDFKPKDFKNMYKWIKHNNLSHSAISIYTPIPGTKIYEKYKDKLITKDPSKYDYLHVVVKPNNMSTEKFYFCYYKLLLKIYLREYRLGVYDFLDYKKIFKTIITCIFRKKKR